MVLLDEINIALRYGYLDLDEVLAFLATRSPRPPTSSSPAATPPRRSIEAADLATEMTLLKHPFRSGVKAQPGVEF